MAILKVPPNQYEPEVGTSGSRDKEGRQAGIQRIYLVGFMGAGKSTVGRILATRLNWHFLDIDSLIEEEQQMSVPALFTAHGEAAFRQLEASAIERLHLAENSVLSLGGGAMESSRVRNFLFASSASRVMFLDAPLATLVERCMAQNGGAGRPILRRADQLEDRFAARLASYRMAHHIVATQSLTPEEVATAIQDCLKLPA